MYFLFMFIKFDVILIWILMFSPNVCGFEWDKFFIFVWGRRCIWFLFFLVLVWQLYQKIVLLVLCGEVRLDVIFIRDLIFSLLIVTQRCYFFLLLYFIGLWATNLISPFARMFNFWNMVFGNRIWFWVCQASRVVCYLFAFNFPIHSLLNLWCQKGYTTYPKT